MKGRIDESGTLWLERGGKERAALCPFHVSSYQYPMPGGSGSNRAVCGDWCPLFGEPKPIAVYEAKDQTTLTLCRTMIVFTDFKDERGAE